jgi:putative FmdB family regulatory protein
MAVYDYLCADCGPFTGMRPMAECDDPASCPGCAASSPRALLTAPQLSCMPGSRRTAFATNERSSHAPKTLGEYKAAHGPGCGCCSAKPSRTVEKARNGAKSFPSARPWMISH